MLEMSGQHLRQNASSRSCGSAPIHVLSQVPPREAVQEGTGGTGVKSQQLLTVQPGQVCHAAQVQNAQWLWLPGKQYVIPVARQRRSLPARSEIGLTEIAHYGAACFLGHKVTIPQLQAGRPRGLDSIMVVDRLTMTAQEVETPARIHADFTHRNAESAA
jgi:hypothetical protein